MTTYNIVFEDDDDFMPQWRATGNISVVVYEVYSPELDGDASITGTLQMLIPRGVDLLPESGQFSVRGTLSAGVNTPVAAFKDFSHYPFAGVDPSMAYIGSTSGSLASAAPGSYARQYASFTGPQDYPVSGGGYAWKRAAYVATGFKFANMTATKDQLLDAVQMEAAPLGATVPSPYSNARSLQVIVKPTRLNYAANPNMESGISGYGETNGSTLGQDSSFYWRGTKSMKVTVAAGSATDGGFSFQVTGMIPGRVYTFSAHIAAAVGCGDIVPWSGTPGTVQGYLTTWRNSASTTDPANPRWRTPSVTFTATASSAYVGMNVDHTTMAAGTASIFWVDGVLVEEGTSVRPYFDGSLGADYLWETNGSANLSRSYYYENRVERSYLVRTLLSENSPLGISAAEPQYAVLPTE